MFHQTNWKDSIKFSMVRLTRAQSYCGWQGSIRDCCTITALYSLTSAAQIQRQDLQYLNIVQSMACTPITNWQRDAKNCWRNRSLDFIKSTNQGPPIFFKKILVVLWVKVRVVMRFSSSALIHNKNNIINIFIDFYEKYMY